MKKVTVNESGIECQIVSGYTDLKNRDMIKLVRIAYLNPLNWEVKLELLKQLFEAPQEVWEKLKHPENHDQVWRLLETLDWVWKGPEYRPMAFMKLRGKTYFLPDEDLHHLSTAEFVIATAHLIGFHSAKDDKTALNSLSKFLATIIRPKPDVMERIRNREENGDPREAYNAIRSDRRALLFDKIDLVTRIMLAQWFNNAANRLLKNHGMTGGDPDAAPISQGIFVQDWERQVVRVAESAVYGNYDKVMERSIVDILAFIEIKNEEIRKEIARKNRK